MAKTNHWVVAGVAILGLAAAGYAYKQFKGDGLYDTSTGTVYGVTESPVQFDSTGNKAVDKSLLRTAKSIAKQEEKTDREAIKQSGKTSRTEIRNETAQSFIKAVTGRTASSTPSRTYSPNISLATGGSAYSTPEGKIIKETTPSQEKSTLRKVASKAAQSVGRIIKITNPTIGLISKLRK